MRKAYRELFDGVHASERLRTEVMNMKNAENTKPRRRVPAAALIAAVLAVALAGTAIAEGVFGLVTASHGTRHGEDGYTFRGDFQTIPMDRLSEDLLEYSRSAGPYDTLAFDSWSEAEEFLGIEVADNARLEQMEPSESGFRHENGPEVRGHCLVMVSSSLALPAAIQMKADYHDDAAAIHVVAVLKVSEQASDTSFSIGNTLGGEFRTETYVTPGGMEATILTSETPMTDLDGSPMVYTQYAASFVKNNAFFYLRSAVGKGKSADQVLATLKEVLDAYE